MNRYVDQWVAPRVKELYGVTLKRVPVKDTVESVQKVVAEKQAGRLTKYIDWDSPIAAYSSGIPVEKMAVSWGGSQWVLAYDSAKIKNPPRSMAALAEWVKANPGKFTHPAPPHFTGRTFLFHVLYEVTGGYQQWLTFDEANWREKSPLLWKYLNEIKPYFWRKGETYPENVSVLDQLYSTGEVWMSMSSYAGVPARNVLKGLYPKTTRTAVLEAGTWAYRHYNSIPFNSSNKAGALVTIDFISSPEAQYQKALPDVWGIGTALDIGRLPKEWQDKFRNIPTPEAALDPVTLAKHQVPGPNAKYIPTLEKGWREQVLLKK